MFSELGDLVLEVHPFDISGTSDALHRALSMSDGERAAHFAALHERVMARTGRPLHELAQVMTRYPQVLVNVPVEDKAEVAASADLAAAVSAARSELGASGRVLVRPSGTEQAVRVMVEALDGRQARRVAVALADTVRDLS